MVGVRVPQGKEGTNETVKIIPQERVQDRTVEQIKKDVLMPQFQEEMSR